jgi:hypothetical protein
LLICDEHAANPRQAITVRILFIVYVISFQIFNLVKVINNIIKGTKYEDENKSFFMDTFGN